MEADHTDYLNLLRELRRIAQGVKKVFVPLRSCGYDYMMADKERCVLPASWSSITFRGQLKVAPEHMSDSVLRIIWASRQNSTSIEQFRRALQSA